MSEEQLKAFLEAVKADADLQAKLEAETDADVVVAVAKEVGFMISAEAVIALNQGKELSDEELESVAAGFNDFGNWDTAGGGIFCPKPAAPINSYKTCQ